MSIEQLRNRLALTPYFAHSLPRRGRKNSASHEKSAELLRSMNCVADIGKLDISFLKQWSLM